MTAKEAIKILREDYCGYNRIICEPHPDKCNQEECEMWCAIKALEIQPDGDCISRSAAVDAVQHAWAKGLEPTQYIEDLPSVQLEIIRCKDCKHHRHNNVGDSWCGHPKGLDGFKLMPNDFCSAAERRTDEQTD